ncbi:CDP-glucose 4,6-dehydratase [Actimicrobium sp. GrIS 1.19]|nr:CDP-glucose 4,6-dehydratase [Actimicrobium sp. GrIS 1.19]
MELKDGTMNQQFWREKRVFLTGHTGFKGAWLSMWLQDLGALVTGYALAPPTSPSLFECANVGAGMTSVIGDIRDPRHLTHAMQEARPDIVIHMAAQPLVRYSYENPVETYETNVLGVVYLLEAIRNTPSVRAVVNVTTDKCYDNKEWIWAYRENEPMGGYDPYSSSKGCSELVTSAYRNSFFNPDNYAQHRVAIASARAGNVIGGGDWASDRLIPDILRAIAERRPVDIRNPLAIRPWQHVLEPLAGYLSLAEKLYDFGPAFASAWNFGPRLDDARPVEWIVGCLTQQWGDGASWQHDTLPQHHEATYLKLDITKAMNSLNWSPKWNLEQALIKIVSWQKAWLNAEDMRAYSLLQIKSYQDTSDQTHIK